MYKTKATALKHIAAGKNFRNKPFDLWRADREVVLAAVRQDGANLLGAPAFQTDLEVVRAACTDWNAVAQWYYVVPKTVWQDRETVLAAVKCFHYALFYVSHELRNDKEIILTALSNCDADSIPYVLVRASKAIGEAIKKIDPDLTNPAAALRQIIDQEALAALDLPTVAPRPGKNRRGLL